MRCVPILVTFRISPRSYKINLLKDAHIPHTYMLQKHMTYCSCIFCLGEPSGLLLESFLYSGSTISLQSWYIDLHFVHIHVRLFVPRSEIETRCLVRLLNAPFVRFLPTWFGVLKGVHILHPLGGVKHKGVKRAGTHWQDAAGCIFCFLSPCTPPEGCKACTFLP